MADFALNFGTSQNTNRVLTVANNAVFQSLSAFTIEAWVYLPQLPAATNGRIFYYIDVSNHGYTLYIDTTSALVFQAGNSSATATLTWSSAISINTLYHIAAVWNGSVLSLFKNGVKYGSTAALSGGNTGNPAIDFMIGGNASNRALPGTIDQPRVSNNARYTVGFTPPTLVTNDANTIEMWLLDEGAAITAAGANGYDGTISGTALPTWVAGLVTSPTVTTSAAGTPNLASLQNLRSL